jgi:hypothetical protein
VEVEIEVMRNEKRIGMIRRRGRGIKVNIESVKIKMRIVKKVRGGG